MGTNDSVQSVHQHHQEDEEARLEEITERTLLVVEGKDDRNFFQALIDHLGLAHLQIVRLDGRHRLSYDWL